MPSPKSSEENGVYRVYSDVMGEKLDVINK